MVLSTDLENSTVYEKDWLRHLWFTYFLVHVNTTGKLKLRLSRISLNELTVPLTQIPTGMMCLHFHHHLQNTLAGSHCSVLMPIYFLARILKICCDMGLDWFDVLCVECAEGHSLGLPSIHINQSWQTIDTYHASLSVIMLYWTHCRCSAQ